MGSPLATPVAAPPPSATERARTIGTGAATTVGIGALLLAGRAADVHLPACPFLTITGLPCPFCGITRLADAVVHLRVGEAAAASPAGVLLLVALAVVASAHALAHLRRRPPPMWVASRALPVAAAVLLAAHWATSLVVGLPG